MSDFEIELTSLAYGGDAIGRLPDGRLVFVPFSLPGEKVTVHLVEEKRQYARAELVDVLEPAAERVAPRCSHYGTCGGCHYQHLSYAGQLQAKQAILKEQLQRIAGIPDPPVQPVVPSPDPWGYRNHVEFHQAASGALGFYKSRTEEVFPIRECHLPGAAISRTWPQLDFELIPGLERIGLRQGMGDDLQLILESSLPDAPEINVEDLPLSVVHLSPWGTLVLAGSEAVEIEVLGRTFRVSAGSFFQANTAIAGKMVEKVLAALTPSDATLLELYCGVGLFSAFLAPRVGRLVGVEASPAACADFEANLDEFDHVELYEASAEQFLGSVEIHPQVVLVDPPRAGLGREVTAGIVALQASTILYVSCDPATLARDARALLEGGYRLESVTPFDAFPQTYHIESLSTWIA